MPNKIIIRPGMSKYQIQQQLKRVITDSLNQQYITWKCPHGHQHRIRIGNIRTGIEHRLHCGCTYKGQ